MLSSVKPEPHNFLQFQAKIFILKCLPAPVSQQTRNIVTPPLIPNTAKNNMENAIMGGYFIKILTSSFLFIWYVDLFTFARDELNINITWLIYSLLSIKIFYKQCSAKHQYSTPWILPDKPRQVPHFFKRNHFSKHYEATWDAAGLFISHRAHNIEHIKTKISPYKIILDSIKDQIVTYLSVPGPLSFSMSVILSS